MLKPPIINIYKIIKRLLILRDDTEASYIKYLIDYKTATNEDESNNPASRKQNTSSDLIQILIKLQISYENERICLEGILFIFTKHINIYKIS